MPEKTREDIINKVTTDYLSTLDKTNPKDPKTIMNELFTLTYTAIETENENSQRKPKLRYFDGLTITQIAMILNHLYPLCVFPSPYSKNKNTIGLYQPNTGLYTLYELDDMPMTEIIRPYDVFIKKAGGYSKIARLLCNLCNNTFTEKPNLIPLQTGILDYETNTLLPFDPCYTFSNKLSVTYTDWQLKMKPMNNQDIRKLIAKLETLDYVLVLFDTKNKTALPSYIEGKLTNITSRTLRIQEMHAPYTTTTVQIRNITAMTVISTLEERVAARKAGINTTI